VLRLGPEGRFGGPTFETWAIKFTQLGAGSHPVWGRPGQAWAGCGAGRHLSSGSGSRSGGEVKGEGTQWSAPTCLDGPRCCLPCAALGCTSDHGADPVASGPGSSPHLRIWDIPVVRVPRAQGALLAEWGRGQGSGAEPGLWKPRRAASWGHPRTRGPGRLEPSGPSAMGLTCIRSICIQAIPLRTSSTRFIGGLGTGCI